MCDKKTSSIVHAQQVPVERVAELMTAAESKLAAFYEAVFRLYGAKQAGEGKYACGAARLVAIHRVADRIQPDRADRPARTGFPWRRL